MPTVLKRSPELTPVPDSTEDPLTASHIGWLGHPWGNSANSQAPGIPLQEQHFHTSLNR